MSWGRDLQRLELGRPLRADRFEFRLLLVGQRGVEVVERRTHGLDRLEHDGEPFADRREPRRRRERMVAQARGLEQIRRLGGGVLERGQLARCASVGRTAASISAVGHSITPGCAAPQLWASEPAVFSAVWLRR